MTQNHIPSTRECERWGGAVMDSYESIKIIREIVLSYEGNMDVVCLG